ncbi:MAG: glycosyltransferase family 4 protein [Kiritimatiellia bacterium]|nr:glycosyltransferase family 4 protein [Kiritimatiellia bacterium]
MNEAPKVLHIITRLDCGGSATDTIVTADLLRKHNFQTALAFGFTPRFAGPTSDPDNSARELLASRKIPCFYLPDLIRNPSPWRDFSALRSISNLLKKERFDLVHTHTSKAGTLGRLAARRCGIPVVHTPHGHIFYGYFGPVLTAFYVSVERRMARLTTRIISLTDNETRESLERGIGWPEQYVSIPTGVPLSFFRDIPESMGEHFRKTLDIPPEVFVFLSVGRLVHIKGFDILIKAFARADFSATGGSASGGKEKNVFLIIVGDGEKRLSIESLVVKLGVAPKVRFAGELRDIRVALSAADAFVLASRNEGMGSVYIEAMASGLPVIGTAVGGVPSVIQDRRTGLLVAGEDPDALARALAEMALNDELRAAMGKNAASSISPEYDEEASVVRIAALYREVLSLKG